MRVYLFIWPPARFLATGISIHRLRLSFHTCKLPCTRRRDTTALYKQQWKFYFATVSSTYVSQLTESRITVPAFRFVSFIIARRCSMIYFSPCSASRKMRKKRFRHRKSVLRSEYSLVSFEGGTEILSTPNERRDDTTFGHSQRIRITSLTSNLVYGPISREYRLRQILFFFFLHVKLQTCALAPHFRYTLLDIRFLSFPFLLFRANVVNTAWTYKTYTRSWCVISARFFSGYTNFSAN